MLLNLDHKFNLYSMLEFLKATIFKVKKYARRMVMCEEEEKTLTLF